MSDQSLQQGNLFTGAWETKRNHKPKAQQASMFSIHETFVWGARAHPKMTEAKAPVLHLVREDVRTPEEVERDLMREAEALTSPLFVEVDLLLKKEIKWEEIDSDAAEPDELEQVPPLEKPAKLTCYLSLVAFAHEQTVTLWVDPAHRARFNSQLPEAILEARSAGLTADEIGAAVQIGTFMGSCEREAGPHVTRLLHETQKITHLHPPAQHEGLRARFRREHIQVRIR